MVTPELVDFARTHNAPSPRGCNCKFIPLDSKWGIKIYYREEDRDYAHRRQLQAYAKGFAPEAGAKFDIDNERWAYITEIAECLISGNDYQFTSGWFDKRDELRKLIPDIENQIDELDADMQRLGLESGDSHYGNFGFLRGKLVRIDFGY